APDLLEAPGEHPLHVSQRALAQVPGAGARPLPGADTQPRPLHLPHLEPPPLRRGTARPVPDGLHGRPDAVGQPDRAPSAANAVGRQLLVAAPPRRRLGWITWDRGWLAAGAAALAWIFSRELAHASLVVDGTRYFALDDDMMVSMRYGRNLAEGQGLVWNVGERVEGYTNFLWTLVMAGVHLLPLR